MKRYEQAIELLAQNEFVTRSLVEAHNLQWNSTTGIMSLLRKQHLVESVSDGTNKVKYCKTQHFSISKALTVLRHVKIPSNVSLSENMNNTLEFYKIEQRLHDFVDSRIKEISEHTSKNKLKSSLKEDGVKVADPNEFESFICVATSQIHVPTVISQKLSTFNGDYFLVAIRKATNEELKEYEENLPPPTIIVKSLKKTCHYCGKMFHPRSWHESYCSALCRYTNERERARNSYNTMKLEAQKEQQNVKDK